MANLSHESKILIRAVAGMAAYGVEKERYTTARHFAKDKNEDVRNRPDIKVLRGLKDQILNGTEIEIEDGEVADALAFAQQYARISYEDWDRALAHVKIKRRGE